MNKKLILREITDRDSVVLLEWRNDKVTQQNSFNSVLVSVNEHKEYIKNTITNPHRTQFILELNEVPIGTIREDRLETDEFELSYTVNPKYRGKKIGQLMMNLYLINRKGSFLCEIKDGNIPSVKMIEKFGFKLFKQEGGMNYYKLTQV